ncbi:hypothetical protein FIV31_07880 [Coxiella endosymbiont of Ornithodoros amblus]|uniref:hypothetical protein n=1 Tax=Coxiella endosymbiont of Ornithodoros amblus TaxID=1656166 RepID=UPI00244DD219|nr:hypothetical protein [Coxiella endosymbiont of Ornithodoros amblus]MBW5803121.1 hypothetical protein [Coxiella endosymbiont of Ornithodoros amblus]
MPEKFEAFGLEFHSLDNEATHTVVDRERFFIFILNDEKTVDNYYIHLSYRNGNKLAVCKLTEIVNK